MRPELATRAAIQGGLVTRRQAISAGYSERELRTATGFRGPWVAVRRGVYVERTQWNVLDERREKPLLRARAAHLSMSSGHVLSHESSGVVLGLLMLDPDPTLVHITRPGVTGSRTEHGVKHHRAHYTPDQVITVDGLEVLDHARTAVDIGRERGYAHGLVACDSALQNGATQQDLVAAIAPMSCWPHVTRARAAVQESDPGAESVGETLARIMLRELDLGPVETQFAVEVDGTVFWADLRIGRHLFEFDGKVKYLSREQGGVARRKPEDVVWEEKRRQDLMCSAGFGMSRIIWSDFWGSARSRAISRLRSEFGITKSRFGSSLPQDHRRIPRRTALVKRP